MQTIYPISGFPEWLPEQAAWEQRILWQLQHVFALHDFCYLRTRAVEPVAILLHKGDDADKEIYGLHRLKAEPAETASSQQPLGLHFDLTVPLARYVAEHCGKLQFPLRRYQMQPVWRGERPQAGRFREFMQVDLDIIGEQTLPAHADVEVMVAMAAAVEAAQLPAMQWHIGHRGLFEQLCGQLAPGQPVHPIMAVVDKLRKIGTDKTMRQLLALGLEPSAAQALMGLCEAPMAHSQGLRQGLTQAGVDTNSLESLGVCCELLTQLQTHIADPVVFDWSIVRGLNYYTGMVCEAYLQDAPAFGAILSGGRYENLTGGFTQGQRYPGVGLSLGLTRLLSYCFTQTSFSSQPEPCAGLFIPLLAWESYAAAWQLASRLRRRGIACSISSSTQKLGKQIRLCERKNIAFMLFPQDTAYQKLTVRHLKTGHEQPFDIEHWQPLHEMA